MDSLPNEIILLILEYCDARSALNALRCCKRFSGLKKLLRDSKLHEEVHILDFTLPHCYFAFDEISLHIFPNVTRTVLNRIMVKGDKMVLCGSMMEFNTDGKLTRLIYDNGCGTGKMFMYGSGRGFTSEGCMVKEIEYVNGKLHGRNITYDANGEIYHMSINFSEGNTRIQDLYHQGRPHSRATYIDDKLVNVFLL